MRPLLCILLLVAISGCDSNVAPPELSIEVTNPTEQAVLNRGESFRLKIDIISALDLRDLDVVISPSVVGERAEYAGRNLRIEQGLALREFVVDTTLIMPLFDGFEGGEYRMMLVSPSGTTNVLKAVHVRVD